MYGAVRKRFNTLLPAGCTNERHASSRPVSRVRLLYDVAARTFTNVGTKGHWQLYASSVAQDLTFRQRTRGATLAGLQRPPSRVVRQNSRYLRVNLAVAGHRARRHNVSGIAFDGDDFLYLGDRRTGTRKHDRLRNGA